MTRKVFITGATGFLGSHIARLCVAEKYDVSILRRETSQLTAIGDLDVEHVIGDLSDVGRLTEQLRGIDWVFHVAAVADYWRAGKDAIYKVNVDGTRNLLQAAEQAGVKRFIFTSSFAAIGHGRPGGSANENTYFNVDPRLSPYGHSKFLAEGEVLKAVERGLDAVILNPSVIIGPGDLNQISGTLILEIARGVLPAMPMHGGTNFIDVRDVSKAHLAAAEKGIRGERYITGAINMTHGAFIRLVCDVLDKPVPKIPIPGVAIPIIAGIVDLGRALRLPIPADGNQMRLSRVDLYADTNKMERFLHRPEITIRQSIRDTYDWYRANGYL